jgi:diguanylate cyclase (GGDEF)-like protein/PAS domain S-box-containing protein
MDPFRAAFAHNADALALLHAVDGSLRVLTVNDAFLRDTGSRHAQIVGAKLDTLLPSDEAKRLDALLSRALASSSVVEFEQTLSTRSGLRAWHVRANAFGPPANRLLIVSARDITWSRNFSQQLTTVASRMPGFVYQLCRSPDGDYRYTFVGERAEDFFGVPVQEVLADANALLGRIHPDDIQRVVDSSLECARAMKPWRSEFRIRHREGRIVWLEANDIPQWLADGTIIWTGYANDITERKALEASLQASEMRFRQLVENADDVIAVIHRGGTVDYISPNCAVLLGYSPSRVAGSRYADLVHPDDRARFLAYVQAVLGGEKPVGGVDYRLQHDNGRWVWQTASAAPLPSADGSIDAVIAISRDISRRHEMEAEIRKLAHFDPVTGLPNRQEFTERLEQAIDMARAERESLALLFIDLDRFKPVNDMHGHAVGDELLRQVGARLSHEVRASDLVARLGGDEFTVLLRSASRTQDAMQVARKLCRVLEMPFLLGSLRVEISASAGVALFPEHGRTPAALLAAADKAMYAAKSSGRNQAALPPDTEAC